MAMQFGLKTTFAILIGFSVCCALLFAVPSYVAVSAIIFLAIVLPAGLTAGVIYTQRDLRAFCIGGLFPAVFMLYLTGWLLASESGVRWHVRSVLGWVEFCDVMGVTFRVFGAVTWTLVVIVGTVVVTIRRLAQ